MALAHLPLLLAVMFAEAEAPAAPKAEGRITVTVVGDDAAAPQPARAMQFKIVGIGGGAAPTGAAAATRTVPFIGVTTSALTPALRAQTTLGEDMGLTIDSVSPGSPAEAAGLKQFDILAKYDDQHLCAAQQLAALVKRTGSGNKASLTVLRGGKELPIEVTVGTHEVSVTTTATAISIGGPGAIMALPLSIEGLTLPGGRDAAGQAAGMIMQQLSGKAPQARSETRSSSSISNDKGQVIVTDVNGSRSVTVIDADGTQRHQGPLDAAELEGIPEEIRDRVQEVLRSLEARPATPAR